VQQQTNMNQAQQLGNWQLATGDWRNATSIVDRMKAVTPLEVQQAAARYLRNARFVAVGDSAKVDRKLFGSF